MNMKNGMSDYDWKELSDQIRRLTKEEHPRLVNYLRTLEKQINHEHVIQSEEWDQIVTKFLEFQKDLTEHIELEDYVIFPKILKAARFDRANLRDLKEKLYASELTEWIAFHSAIREELDSLNSINEIIDKHNLHGLSGYVFKEFDTLLREHANFEDNILFPAALKLAINDLPRED